MKTDHVQGSIKDAAGAEKRPAGEKVSGGMKDPAAHRLPHQADKDLGESQRNSSTLERAGRSEGEPHANHVSSHHTP
jgi:hypothetical protein